MWKYYSMKLKSIKRINSNSKRYDIQTKSKNFYANGVLVHNSLIIWGIHNNEIIHRTRGTFNATNMANGQEIEFLKNKYPKLLVAIHNNKEYSILTEWQTKTNVIVINEVSEPTLTLIGAIHNETGKLVTQNELDTLSEAWEIDRPKRYHYNSISECISDVELWEGKEGVVLYSEDGQKLRKCKSEWYRTLHAMATGIKGINQVLDVFMASPKFIDDKEFYSYIETTLDYEIAEKCKDFIKSVTDTYRKIKGVMLNVDETIDFVKTFESRKEQALYINERFNGWVTSYAFMKLDNKEIDDKIIKKAMEKELDLC